MKSKIAIFLTCMHCFSAIASDCSDGFFCEMEPMNSKSIQKTATPGAPAVLHGPAFNENPAYYMEMGPALPVRAVEIKPTLPDDRPPLWDGSGKKFKSRGYDKTVDWRDGVPIWDDSISSYRDKDFSDWYMQPAAEMYYIEDEAQQITDISTRIEEILAPAKPDANLWFKPNKKFKAQDLSCAINTAFESKDAEDGCPFETESECAIWRKKPMVRETVSPRSHKFRSETMDAIIEEAQTNSNTDANNKTMAPLMDRYRMLMKSANACCSDGMAYELKKAGASDGLVYKFMSDDANFYQIGTRCLMMTDSDLDKKYPNTATAAVAADVRNGCLCRGRQWFGAMLAPFQEVYKAVPEFAESKFNYTYTDGLQRKTTVSVNNDVKNVLNQLELCP